MFARASIAPEAFLSIRKLPGRTYDLPTWSSIFPRFSCPMDPDGSQLGLCFSNCIFHRTIAAFYHINNWPVEESKIAQSPLWLFLFCVFPDSMLPINLVKLNKES